MLREMVSLPRSAQGGKVRTQDAWLQGSGFQTLLTGIVFHAWWIAGLSFRFFLTLTWLPKTETIFRLQCADVNYTPSSVLTLLLPL